jgi:drug/metabolite transporter (DMT)-like permease
MCLAAQICGACYLVFFTDLIQKYSAFTLMKWMFLISAVAIFPFTIGGIVNVPWSEMPLGGILDTLYIVVLATCLAYLFTPIGQKHVSPTVVAIYNYLQPVVAAVISIIAGLAVVSWETALYAFLIFLGVWLVSRN